MDCEKLEIGKRRKTAEAICFVRCSCFPISVYDKVENGKTGKNNLSHLFCKVSTFFKAGENVKSLQYKWFK